MIRLKDDVIFLDSIGKQISRNTLYSELNTNDFTLIEDRKAKLKKKIDFFSTDALLVLIFKADKVEKVIFNNEQHYFPTESWLTINQLTEVQKKNDELIKEILTDKEYNNEIPFKYVFDWGEILITLDSKGGQSNICFRYIKD